MSKTKYRVKNWSEYNKALKIRGSVTFWFDNKPITQWWHDTANEAETCIPRPGYRHVHDASGGA